MLRHEWMERTIPPEIMSETMIEMTPQLILFVLGVAGLTAGAAFWDFYQRRIPNKLTLPVFVLGIAYQCVFNGLSGLGDASLAFLLGFGTLFVLWIVGGGGGGDVKLMGALSVWLGFRITLYVMIVSTIFVILASALVMVWKVLTQGTKKMKKDLLGTGKEYKQGAKHVPETAADKSKRRVMAYALPVSLATWVVVLWKLPTFPW